MEDLLVEYTATLPVTLTIERHKGNRYQLKINEEVFNIFGKEQVYTLFEEGVFAFGIARTVPEPSAIKLKLKQIVASVKRVFDRPFVDGGV